MPGIANDQLLDLTKTTLQNLPNLEFEMAMKNNEYPVMNQWFQGDKVEVESGTSIVRNIILETSGNARHVRLYQKTPINVSDIQFQVTAPWVQLQTHWSIERREALRNRAPARFIDLLQTRRLDAVVDLADMLEAAAWVAPSGSTDDLAPYGVPYWLSMLEDDTSTAGFNAYRVRWNSATYTGTTTKGGIDGSAQTRWRNYADLYTAINATFIARLRKAFHATNFKSPMIAKDLTQGPRSQYRLYTGLQNLCDYEDLVTQANDNLGPDLDPYHGNTTFRRVPIQYVNALDSLTVLGGNNTVNSPLPWYGVNHAKFYPIVLSGDWLREEPPMKDVEQHNVVTAFIDGSYQFFCKNVREAGFVIHKNIGA